VTYVITVRPGLILTPMMNTMDAAITINTEARFTRFATAIALCGAVTMGVG